MVYLRFLAVVLSLSLPAEAQTLRGDAGPVNLPPAGYSGSQFVDNRGCVYIRAGRAGAVTWVPRVSRDRRLVCGRQPTFAEGGVASAGVRPASTVPAPRIAAPAPEATRIPGRHAAILRIEGYVAPIPKGYRPVFTDGRHNPRRGLPGGKASLHAPLR